MEKSSISQASNQPTVGLSPKDLVRCVTDQARGLLTFNQAIQAQILPMGFVELAGKRQILVATADTSSENYRLIKFVLNGTEPHLVKIDPQVLKEAIFIAYHREPERVEKALIAASQKQEPAKSKAIVALRDVSSPENDLLCGLLDYSVAWDASDLHIMPSDGGMLISIRVGGQLRVRDTLVRNQTLYSRLVQRLKVVSKLDITQKNSPQEGSFEIPLAHGAMNARVSFVPSVLGESLSIRFFKKSGCMFLSSLGYTSEIENKLRDIINLDSGVLIVCGSTGAGKTTAMYALARELINQSKRVISIEDPVENVIGGMTQIQVNDEKRITFDSGLKAILRQDPDVIVIGEVRERSVANTMIQAALTGHLVLATLHAGSVDEAKLRLLDWGLSDHQIKIAVKGILFQQLIYKDTNPVIEASFSL
jgi:type II secretory ATPase GspE/PulE/Tfp pilus assembly ATPase PilB-like protein